jgi:hypothetical protein
MFRKPFQPENLSSQFASLQFYTFVLTFVRFPVPSLLCSHTAFDNYPAPLGFTHLLFARLKQYSPHRDPSNLFF